MNVTVQPKISGARLRPDEQWTLPETVWDMLRIVACRAAEAHQEG